MQAVSGERSADKCTSQKHGLHGESSSSFLLSSHKARSGQAIACDDFIPAISHNGLCE